MYGTLSVVLVTAIDATTFDLAGTITGWDQANLRAVVVEPLCSNDSEPSTVIWVEPISGIPTLAETVALTPWVCFQP